MLKLLTHMRDSPMDDAVVDLLLSCCLENLEPEERAKFKDAVHLTPTWEEAYRVMAHHLINTLTGLIAKIHAELTSCHASNCLLKENALPAYNALCASGKVMLNCSIGDLIDIKFADPAGPNADKPKGCAIINFPLSNILADKALIPGLPSTYTLRPYIWSKCAVKRSVAKLTLSHCAWRSISLVTRLMA